MYDNQLHYQSMNIITHIFIIFKSYRKNLLNFSYYVQKQMQSRGFLLCIQCLGSSYTLSCVFRILIPTAEQKRETPDARQTNKGIYYTADYSGVAAEKPCDKVETEYTDTGIEIRASAL